MSESNSFPLWKLAKPIFENLYSVRVRARDTWSVADVRKFGVPTVNDKRIDAQMHDDYIDRYIKINDMVEYFRQDIPFILTDKNSAPSIYHIVTAYLQGYLDYLKYALNISEIPVEDLVLLDTLAMKMYPYVTEVTPSTTTFFTGLAISKIGSLEDKSPGKVDVKPYVSFIPELSKYVHSLNAK